MCPWLRLLAPLVLHFLNNEDANVYMPSSHCEGVVANHASNYMSLLHLSILFFLIKCVVHCFIFDFLMPLDVPLPRWACETYNCVPSPINKIIYYSPKVVGKCSMCSLLTPSTTRTCFLQYHNWYPQISLYDMFPNFVDLFVRQYIFNISNGLQSTW